MRIFHKDAGPVPDTLRRLVTLFEKEGIEYIVIGAFALGVHHYRRATEDVCICLRPKDLERFRQNLVGTVYQKVEGRPRRFYDPKTEVTLDLLVSGELAGDRVKNRVIRFPDPSEATDVDGLATVSLECLIELKLVTWRIKDMADVIALIRRNNLDEVRQEREYGGH